MLPHKKTTSSVSAPPKTTHIDPVREAKSQPTPAPSAKRRSGLKAKAAATKRSGEGHVLGGADYVSLMMGSRKQAREEAKKLPKD